MKTIKIRFNLENMSGDATDWIEEIEGKLAETMYKLGYRGELVCENTGNSVRLRDVLL